MYIVSTILILNIAGFLGAWQPDIDINRLRLIKNEDAHYRPRNTYSRRSIFTRKFRNDNDHNSSRFSQLWSPVQPVSDPPSAEPKAIKVHKPREDPRLFYQSDTYAKEVIGNSLNNEVAAVYPGRDVVRTGEQYYRKSYPARLRERGTKIVPHDEICVTCPHDRTIIAKPGSDRVRLPHPRLTSCRGYKVSRDVKFIPMYGPKFGSLLQKGSHGILGQISYKNKMLRYCYMTVHVLIQTCALPKYLIADCRDENKTCSFECRDPKAELRGSSMLTCGDDNMQWLGQLPVCSAQTWCESVSPPDHGRVSCKGETVDGWGLADGAICRIKCAKGWKSNTKLAVCRRGVWSQNFTCTAKIQGFL